MTSDLSKILAVSDHLRERSDELRTRAKRSLLHLFDLAGSVTHQEHIDAIEGLVDDLYEGILFEVSARLALKGGAV